MATLMQDVEPNVVCDLAERIGARRSAAELQSMADNPHVLLRYAKVPAYCLVLMLSLLTRSSHRRSPRVQRGDHRSPSYRFASGVVSAVWISDICRNLS